MEERFGLQVPPHARPPIAWYALGGLRRIAREQLWSLNLLRNLDRRETFTGPLELIDLRGLADADGGFWLDFVADTGDGGSATTAVAQAMLRPALQAEAAPHPLPEARLLILGGDLAYPGASPEAYQARLVEMFELAAGPGRRFAEVPPRLAHHSAWEPTQKIVAAIPQNHDWLDSASTFCRTFVNDEKSGLLGARAPQSRTYWAMALPHGWYALGFDFALTGDLDRAQFEAFEALLDEGRIPPGAQLVLVYPEPFWTRTLRAEWRPAYPRRYQRLEARLLRHGASIRLRLAGDLHHYARERCNSVQPHGLSSDLVTCGSGGAFGHGTHVREVSQPKFMHIGVEEHAAQAELRERVLVYRDAPGAPLAFGREFDALRQDPQVPPPRYPAPEATRRAAWRNPMALLGVARSGYMAANLSFALMVGTLLMAAALLPWSLAWMALAGMALAALLLSSDNDPARAEPADLAAGAALAALHGLAALALRDLLQGQHPLLWLLAWPAAVLAAALGNGLHLAVMSALLGRLVNNSASALADEGAKGFLRMRLGPQGAQAWMLGCDEVPRRWRARADDAARPRWQPADGTEPAWRVVDRFDMPTPPAA